jgi:hypothetical protein
MVINRRPNFKSIQRSKFIPPAQLNAEPYYPGLNLYSVYYDLMNTPSACGGELHFKLKLKIHNYSYMLYHKNNPENLCNPCPETIL